MGDVQYKQYTKEEDVLYNDSIDALRIRLASGMKFDEACDKLNVTNADLRECIVADFLKICIAEMHYGKGMSIKELSLRLAISEDRVLVARKDMYEDIENAAISEYHKEQSKGRA
ncbi:MAG: hypothetical protein HQK89_11920 [Nitrospirae bacterium]|nr:hypothetical protein [Nitrospirota bacterium]